MQLIAAIDEVDSLDLKIRSGRAFAREKIARVDGATPLLAERIETALASGAARLGFVDVAVSSVIDHERLR